MHDKCVPNFNNVRGRNKTPRIQRSGFNIVFFRLEHYGFQHQWISFWRLCHIHWILFSSSHWTIINAYSSFKTEAFTRSRFIVHQGVAKEHITGSGGSSVSFGSATKRLWRCGVLRENTVCIKERYSEIVRVSLIGVCGLQIPSECVHIQWWRLRTVNP